MGFARFRWWQHFHHRRVAARARGVCPSSTSAKIFAEVQLACAWGLPRCTMTCPKSDTWCSSRAWGVAHSIFCSFAISAKVAARTRGVCHMDKTAKLQKCPSGCSSRARGVCVRFCSFAVFDICSSRTWGLPVRAIFP